MESVLNGSLRQKNSDEEFSALEQRLHSLLSSDVKNIARQRKVKLAGANKKSDLIACLLAKSRLGTLRSSETSTEDPSSALPSLSYLTVGVTKRLEGLPAFDDVKDSLTKTVADCSENFHFVHLHAYLIESRDKTFDVQSVQASRRVKGYKYFF